MAFVGLHWPFWPLWPWMIFLKQKLAFADNNQMSKSISEGDQAF